MSTLWNHFPTFKKCIIYPGLEWNILFAIRCIQLLMIVYGVFYFFSFVVTFSAISASHGTLDISSIFFFVMPLLIIFYLGFLIKEIRDGTYLALVSWILITTVHLLISVLLIFFLDLNAKISFVTQKELSDSISRLVGVVLIFLSFLFPFLISAFLLKSRKHFTSQKRKSFWLIPAGIILSLILIGESLIIFYVIWVIIFGGTNSSL